MDGRLRSLTMNGDTTKIADPVVLTDNYRCVCVCVCASFGTVDRDRQRVDECDREWGLVEC